LSNKRKIKIAVSAGDPRGIGYDLCILILKYKFNFHITFFANLELLIERAKKLRVNIKKVLENNSNTLPFSFVDIPQKKNDSKYRLLTLETIKCAVESCHKHKTYDALVTLPINKNVLSTENYKFTGHTEYISKLCNSKKKPIMAFFAPKKNFISINSTHVSLKKAIKEVSKENIVKNILEINSFLQCKFNISKPKILITGLNPHAGENGLFGKEEQNIIIPAIHKLKLLGVHIDGPVSGDIAFIPKYRTDYDCIYYMFHDQALAAFKTIFFEAGVNLTIGYPFVRTSVDHGTAEEIIGKKDLISTKSFYNSLNLAYKLSKSRK